VKKKLVPLQGEPPPISLLWPGLLLAVILVAAKAATFERAWHPHFASRVFLLVMASASDVCFAIGVSLVGQLLVRATSSRPQIARWINRVWLGVLTLCAFYGAASVGLFRYFGRPLTYDLLRLVGNASAVRSSITERLTLPLTLSLVGAPLLFLLAALVLPRWRRGAGIGLIAAGAWALIGWQQQARHRDNDEIEYRHLSPHVELLRTGLARLGGGRRPSFARDIPPEATAQFRTFGARDAVGHQASGFQLPAGAARPRNVIVIVLESVATRYLNLYGSGFETVPNLVAESSSAVVFENIYAHASFTYCSLRSINFSQYPGLPWHYALLGDARPFPPTLAKILRSRGWRTAYINNGNVDWEDERWLLENAGYETIDDYTKLGCPELSSWGTEDRCLVDRLIRWIDEKPGQSFLAVCWTDQTHDPYPLGPGVAPIDFFGGSPPPAHAKDLSNYLNVVHETDRHLGRLFAALRERGLADDTLVVVTGDHGEAFGDPHSQRGHAWTVYEEETHVPLIFWNPRLFAPGRRLQTIGGHVDLNPTIADLIGIEPARDWQGHSLFDANRPARAFFMAIAGGDVFGVREENWKYVYDVTDSSEMLFDLARDPKELVNRVRAEPARAAWLRQQVGAWVTFEDAYLWNRQN
jgi:arylsulfatase A-like enzyme